MEDYSDRDHMYVGWKGKGQQAQCPPNPDYPEGKPIDMSEGKKHCKLELQHPAPSIGVWVIYCHKCGIKIAISAAGRTDDPSTVKIKCRS